MSSKKFIHELADIRVLFDRIEQEQGKVLPQLIEKDYWLMHCLWGLKSQRFIFEMKGGTSLSKGFGIIDRFSEDIDIKIEPPASLEVKIGKNQDKTSQIKSRINFYDWLAKEISIPGVVASRDITFDDKKGRNGGIRLSYNSTFPTLAGIKPYVLLEVGFDITTPNEKLTISSWVYDYVIKLGLDVMDNRALEVPCYLPGYTFIEKLSAISGKYQKEKEGTVMPVNFIRHYYDIYQLLGNESVQKFIGTKEYLEHKMNRFRVSDGKDLTKNEAFILSDRSTRKRYAEEYKRTQALYYGGFPDFDKILERIQSNLGRL